MTPTDCNRSHRTGGDSFVITHCVVNSDRCRVGTVEFVEVRAWCEDQFTTNNGDRTGCQRANAQAAKRDAVDRIEAEVGTVVIAIDIGVVRKNIDA